MPNIRVGRKSGFIQRSGRMRRESIWLFQGPFRQGLAAASTAVLGTSLNAAALALRPFTVVRTHLHFQVKSDQTAASEFYQAALGMAVVSDQAVAIGITAVPTPFTDMGSDLWFLHQILQGDFTFLSGVGVMEIGGQLKDVDSRAMRKVEDGQDLVGIVETSSLSTGAVAGFAGRQLIKLH